MDLSFDPLKYLEDLQAAQIFRSNLTRDDCTYACRDAARNLFMWVIGFSVDRWLPRYTPERFPHRGIKAGSTSLVSCDPIKLMLNPRDIFTPHTNRTDFQRVSA